MAGHRGEDGRSVAGRGRGPGPWAAGDWARRLVITVRKRFAAGAVARADRLRSEFDDAFPDEVPPSQRGDGAAAA